MPEIVIQSRPASISAHMEVKRILPFRLRRMVGPFIFMDHAGPVSIDPASAAGMDVLPHPHIGLSTVSYLFGGQVTHRDSLGVEQVILPGEVNWMTAGCGISHSERFEHPASLAGGLEMIQTWVALPEEDEENLPTFANYKSTVLPVIESNGSWMRLIAGTAYGMSSPVVVNSPLLYMHATLGAGKKFTLPSGYSELGIYIVSGMLEIAHKSYAAGVLVVFGKNESPAITALSDSVFMVLGGEPLGHRHIWWNFVSSRKDRIEQAKADWKEGRISLPPADNQAFIPLPEERRQEPPAPEALS